MFELSMLLDNCGRKIAYCVLDKLLKDTGRLFLRESCASDMSEILYKKNDKKKNYTKSTKQKKTNNTPCTTRQIKQQFFPLEHKQNLTDLSLNLDFQK